jgi:hypothetical protein
LRDAWKDAFGSNAQVGYHSIVRHPELFRHPTIIEGLVHPLFIALLAYRLGGPVTAANTATAHQWKLPDQSKSEVQVNNFHIEGDDGDIFNDHRVTLVWEESDISTNTIGEHHIFQSGDATPRMLAMASPIKSDRHSTLLTVLYDSKNAALAYECQEQTVIRKSISLDFHVNAVSDDVIHLLHCREPDELEYEDLTLAELVTNFPNSNYYNHFHRLLFSPESLQAIVEKLLSIDIAAPKLPPQTQSDFQQRLDTYSRENIFHIPPQILSLEKDLLVSGTFSSVESFLELLSVKAQRDAHLPIGSDLFPHDAVDQSREWARKFLRDSVCHIVSRRLAAYTPALTQSPYTAHDILSTIQLHGLANIITTRCLELVSTGYTDPYHMLPSLPSFATVLGNAINGLKEVQVLAEPWIDERDFQIYRTRCLYLFWCADWLVDYLGKPIEGPFMLREVGIKEMVALRGSVVVMARLLLRNWVAWGLFVEGLPSEGFWVGGSKM